MKKLKVLLVDDNPLPLAVGKDILESGGYQVITAKDGIEALRLLSLQTFTAGKGSEFRIEFEEKKETQ